MLTIEAEPVRVDHLEETGGRKTVVDEFPPAFGELPLEANTALKWFELHSVREVRAS